jgi:hypothetical protein
LWRARTGAAVTGVVEESARAAVDWGGGGVGWGTDQVAAQAEAGAEAGAIVDGHRALAWPRRCFFFNL